MNYFKIITTALLASAYLVLSGCATVIPAVGHVTRPSYADYNNTVYIASARVDENSWGQRTTYARYAYHWDEAPEAQKLRWVRSDIATSDNFFTRRFLFSNALVPDNIPRIQQGAIVLIQNNVENQTDYRTLNVPKVLALICQGPDMNCGKRVGAAIKAGKLPKFGRPMTPAQIATAEDMSTVVAANPPTYTPNLKPQTVTSAGEDQ